MDLVLCHTTADFDTLGAAVGVSVLHPGTRIVLAGGCHPTVQRFLAFHRDEYALMERRAVPLDQIQNLTVVDTHRRSRLGPVADWLDAVTARGGTVTLYDHHGAGEGDRGDIPAQVRHVATVGAATTLVAEQLQAQGKTLAATVATVMALGIHVDTGSLTFETTTPRDAAALAWLMAQGAAPRTIAEFVEPQLSPTLRPWLEWAIAHLHRERHPGHTLAWVQLPLEGYVPGLSGLADRLMTLGDVDSLLLAATYPTGTDAVSEPGPAESVPAETLSADTGPAGTGRAESVLAESIPKETTSAGTRPAEPVHGETVPNETVPNETVPNAAPIRAGAPYKLVLIGRVRGRGAALGEQPGVDFNAVLTPHGGGGHATAAAAMVTTADPHGIVQGILADLRRQIPPPPTAREVMSSPVRTLRPHTSIAEAQRVLLRYGHSGLSVVDEADRLVGVISRRDIDLALHHGFSHAPVKGYMTTDLKTIEPDTPLPQIETLMVTYDVGRLPVLAKGQLVGMVTRTDVLRQRQMEAGGEGPATLTATRLPALSPDALRSQLAQRLQPRLGEILGAIAAIAAAQDWHLYVVGGAVRDLFLTPTSEPLHLKDVDLVVDGAGTDLREGAGAWLAQAVQRQFPEADLQVYGRFQTAALVWHGEGATGQGSLMIDIATARTEFYPYPAANPEVEASSIRQDLYRRDFTINAMAIRLTPPRAGLLLDFFGGRRDLHQRQVRVLHANSFIEDPTRIYRAVRFAVRLDFTLDAQTEGFIHHAIHSGIYTRLQQEMARLPALQTRLKAELKLILEAPYWQAALALLDRLGALVCLHPDLKLSDRLWHQMRRVSRWMAQIPALASLTPWQMRLEVLILAIPPGTDRGATPNNPRATVATNLQLPADSIQRLSHFASAESALLAALPGCDRPSQAVEILSAYDLGTLMLVSVRHPKQVGQEIWRYLMHWSQVRAPLDGNDLRALGYPPGPQYRVMLAALLAATLDGEVGDRATAIAFLQQHF
ncbi:MAG: CBS domain-containing protein [Leptolyngbya sp.]|nr:CBS domain-containing protein [Leptolyngbya sp.]